MTDKQKSPEEVADDIVEFWMTYLKHPEDEPPQFSWAAEIAQALRERDAYWEKWVGLPSEEKFRCAYKEASSDLKNMDAVSDWAYRYLRTHLRESQLAAVWPSDEEIGNKAYGYSCSEELGHLGADAYSAGAKWLRSQVKLVDVGELVEALKKAEAALVVGSNAERGAYEFRDEWKAECDKALDIVRAALAKFRNQK